MKCIQETVKFSPSIFGSIWNHFRGNEQWNDKNNDESYTSIEYVEEQVGGEF